VEAYIRHPGSPWERFEVAGKEVGVVHRCADGVWEDEALLPPGALRPQPLRVLKLTVPEERTHCAPCVPTTHLWLRREWVRAPSVTLLYPAWVSQKGRVHRNVWGGGGAPLRHGARATNATDALVVPRDRSSHDPVYSSTNTTCSVGPRAWGPSERLPRVPMRHPIQVPG